MKIKVTVRNSYCQVQGLTPQLEALLKEEMRYMNQSVAYTYHTNLRIIKKLKYDLSDDAKVKLSGQERADKEKQLQTTIGRNNILFRELYKVLLKDDRFATGLLPKFLSIVNGIGAECEVEDLRRRPQKYLQFVLKQPFPPLRYYQRTLSRLAVERGRGIGIAPTGTGKTLTINRMIWELGVRTLVVTPNKDISVNMVDTLEKHFGKGHVTRLSTKSGKRSKTPPTLKDINVVNIQSLVKMDPELFKDIDCVIIDEFHHAAAETYQEVNEKHLANVYFRIGMTATNFRNDGADLALEAVLSEVLYEYTIKQAIEDGFLIKPRFHIEPMVLRPLSSYQKEYKSEIVENEERNDVIAQIAAHHEKDSVLILVKQVEHGEKLKALIPGSAFLHGEEKDDVRRQIMEDYRAGKITKLIGTSVIGEGVDLPIAKILIMAGGGKARSAVMQNIGRVLRPFPGKDEALVYDFTDEESSYQGEHSLIRQDIYDQYEVGGGDAPDDCEETA